MNNHFGEKRFLFLLLKTRSATADYCPVFEMSAYFLILLSILSIHDTNSSKISFFSHEENIARKLMDVLNEEYGVIKHQEALFTYYYNVDINEENLERMVILLFRI